jgi:uncharacterized protein YbgA (DUF1722 family)
VVATAKLACLAERLLAVEAGFALGGGGAVRSSRSWVVSVAQHPAAEFLRWAVIGVSHKISGSEFELSKSAHRLSGFVVCVQSYKKDSPSSGLFRVKVYNEHGMAQRNGTGMFPREVMNRFPLLPLEEEGRLNDMPLRENFIERVFAYYRWTKMLEEEPTPGGLVKFHTAHKLTLMAHSPKHYTEMGRLVADAGKRDWDELTAEHGAQLMEGLAVMGSRGKHVNVLQHLMGFLKNQLSSEDKQELLGLIEDYRQGLVPLIVPLTLLKHHLNRDPVPDWVHQQVYLHPYPKELMLRNHV